jgi:hypothetical protein
LQSSLRNRNQQASGRRRAIGAAKSAVLPGIHSPERFSDRDARYEAGQLPKLKVTTFQPSQIVSPKQRRIKLDLYFVARNSIHFSDDRRNTYGFATAYINDF